MNALILLIAAIFGFLLLLGKHIKVQKRLRKDVKNLFIAFFVEKWSEPEGLLKYGINSLRTSFFKDTIKIKVKAERNDLLFDKTEEFIKFAQNKTTHRVKLHIEHKSFWV